MNKAFLPVFLTSLLLAGCLPQAVPHPIPTLPSEPTIPSPTAVLEPTATISPSSTATTPLLKNALVSTQLSAWKIIDFHDPSVPDLILKDKNGYQLDHSWKVVKIDYTYNWGGIPEHDQDVSSHQTIVRRGNIYMNGLEAVNKALVDAFLASIDHLYPSQFLLSGYAGTDDYPSWSVQLTGEDGQTINVESSSTGNPGSGPWNVIHNSRAYAQYDGSIGDTLASLFVSPAGKPSASFYPGGRDLNTAEFETRGYPFESLPDRIFTGLIPIADDFRYSPDIDHGKIDGYISVKLSTDSPSKGKDIQVSQVVIQANGSLISCPIQPDPVSNGFLMQEWAFTCEPGDGIAGEYFDYPIHIDLNVDKTESLSLDGELKGIWDHFSDMSDSENYVIFSPLPDEIKNAIQHNQSASELLQKNIFIYAYYDAAINPDNPQSGVDAGEIILLGQTEIAGSTVRYTVGTPFVMQNGELTRWALNNESLGKLLSDVANLALTERVLAADPDFILNLWYAESGEMPEFHIVNDGYYFDMYATQFEACGNLKAQKLPMDGVPFQAFGFNSMMWNMWMPDFVLVDGEPVVNELNLSPNQNPRGGILSILTPSVLNTGDSLPFDRIWVEAGSSIFAGPPTLTLNASRAATDADLATYQKIIKSLPAPADSYSTWWEIHGLTFIVTVSGTLEAKACK
jgi:hypothetical protein